MLCANCGSRVEKGFTTSVTDVVCHAKRKKWETTG